MGRFRKVKGGREGEKNFGGLLPDSSVIEIDDKGKNDVVFTSIHGTYLSANPDKLTVGLEERYPKSRQFWKISVKQPGRIEIVSQIGTILTSEGVVCQQLPINERQRAQEKGKETAWEVRRHDGSKVYLMKDNRYLRATPDGHVDLSSRLDFYCLWTPFGGKNKFADFCKISQETPELLRVPFFPTPLSKTPMEVPSNSPDTSPPSPISFSETNPMPSVEHRFTEEESSELWSMLDFTSLLTPPSISHWRMNLVEKCRVFNPAIEWLNKEEVYVRGYTVNLEANSNCCSSWAAALFGRNCEETEHCLGHGLNIIVLAKCKLIWSDNTEGIKVPGVELLHARYFDITPGEFVGNFVGSEDPRISRNPEGAIEIHVNALNNTVRTVFTGRINPDTLMIFDVHLTQFDLRVKMSDMSRFVEKNWCPVSCSSSRDPYFFILRSKPLLAYARSGKLNTETTLVDAVNRCLALNSCSSIRGSTPGIVVDAEKGLVLFVTHTVQKLDPSVYPLPAFFVPRDCPGSFQEREEWYEEGLKKYQNYRKRYYMSFVLYKFIPDTGDIDEPGDLTSENKKMRRRGTVSLEAYTPFFLPPNRFEENCRIFFPCGLLEHGNSFLVSYGEGDATCRLVTFDKAEVLLAMKYEIPEDHTQILQPDLFERQGSTCVGCNRQFPFSVLLFDSMNIYPPFLAPENGLTVNRCKNKILCFDASLHFSVRRIPQLGEFESPSISSAAYPSGPNTPLVSSRMRSLSEVPQRAGPQKSHVSESQDPVAMAPSPRLRAQSLPAYPPSPSPSIRSKVSMSQMEWRDTSNAFSLLGAIDYSHNLLCFSQPHHKLYGTAETLPPLDRPDWSLAIHFFYSPSPTSVSPSGKPVPPFITKRAKGVLYIDVIDHFHLDDPNSLHEQGYFALSFSTSAFLVPLTPNAWHSCILSYTPTELLISLNGMKPRIETLPDDPDDIIREVAFMSNSSGPYVAVSELIMMPRSDFETEFGGLAALDTYFHTKWSRFCPEFMLETSPESSPLISAPTSGPSSPVVSRRAPSETDSEVTTLPGNSVHYWAILWRVRTAHYRYFLDKAEAYAFYEKRCTKKGTKVMYDGPAGGKMLCTNAENTDQLQNLLNYYYL